VGTPEPAIKRTDSVTDIDLKKIVEIQQYKLWLEVQGYKLKTVKSSISNLKTLAKHSDIGDPESVKRARPYHVPT